MVTSSTISLDRTDVDAVALLKTEIFSISDCKSAEEVIELSF